MGGNSWLAFVIQVLKRILLGCLCQGVLPAALNDMKFSWDIKDSLEDELAAIIKKDSNDYSAKKKLRLLRVSKLFCRESTAWELAVVVGNLSIVDKVLYTILGHGGKSRAGLKDLLSEESSVISKSKEELLRLLREWGTDSDVWEMALVAGIRFDSIECRRFSRRDILQLSCSMLDHTELRMARPPYSLVKIADPAVANERKLELAREILDTPSHCVSLFQKNLREQYPTVTDLLEHSPKVVTALDRVGFLAIDFCERSHGQMRKDLHSDGKGKSFTISSNRVFCSEMKAAHLEAGGVDPREAPWVDAKASGADEQQLVAAAAGDHAPGGIGRLGGNGKFEYSNQQRSIFKQLHAPDRPLTEGEMETMNSRISRGWTAFSDHDRSQWDSVAHSNAEKRRIKRLAGRAEVGDVAREQRWKPLWGCKQKKSHQCIPPEEIVKEHGKLGAKRRRQKARKDDFLRLASPIDNKVSTSTTNDKDLIFGCAGLKKNVCRAVLPEPIRVELDMLTSRC